MTATQIRPAGWAETAQLVAAQRHVYGTDVTRIGSSVRRYYD